MSMQYLMMTFSGERRNRFRVPGIWGERAVIGSFFLYLASHEWKEREPFSGSLSLYGGVYGAVARID
jgi:hypothetical protein